MKTLSDKRTGLFATGRITFGRNLFSNLALIGISLAIGIWFVPYLVKELGTVQYGFLPLAANAISFLAIPAVALSLSVSRRLTLNVGNSDKARSVFNTALILSVGTAIVTLIPLGIWIFRPAWFHQVPAGLETGVSRLFLFAGVGFILTTVGIAFQSVSLATNRLDVHNGISVLHRLTRIATTLLLFTLYSPTLFSAGLALVVAGVVELMAHIVSWRKLMPDITLNLRSFDSEQAKEFGRQSIWLILTTLGGLLMLSTDVILVNRLLGPEATTDYSLALQWIIILRLFAGALSGALHPTLLRMHESHSNEERLETTQRSVKFVGFAVAIATAILCGLAESFLTLWLGPEFTRLVPLIVLHVAIAPLYLAVQPLYSIVMAADKIKTPGIVTLVAGFLSVVAALLSVLVFDWGMIGVAGAVGLLILLRNVGFYPIYAARVLGASPRTLYVGLIKVAVAFAIFWPTTFLIGQWLSPSTWPAFLALASGLGTVFLAGAIFLGLNRHDRQGLKTWLTPSDSSENQNIE